MGSKMENNLMEFRKEAIVLLNQLNELLASSTGTNQDPRRDGWVYVFHSTSVFRAIWEQLRENTEPMQLAD